MNAIVEQFRQFLGDKLFEQFVRDLHGECRSKNRLRFWQEKRWREFCDLRGAAEGNFEEISGIFLQEYTLERIESAFPRYDPWKCENRNVVECNDPPSPDQVDQIGSALHRVAPFDPLIYRDQHGAVHIKASRYYFLLLDYKSIEALLNELEDIDAELDPDDRFDAVMSLLGQYGEDNGMDSA